ncbi:MAG: class I tRNA ligase family protein, partial [Patescibacteria group bacterium]
MKKKKEFPKAYEPKGVEDAIYARWERSGFFNPDTVLANRHRGAGSRSRDKSQTANRGKGKGRLAMSNKPFTIVMPPPNVTGTLHVGHAVMLALEDLMIRYHRMRGDRSLWIPGTDHAAIATQTKVEKKLWEEQKKTRHDLGREAFLREVEKFARESKTTIHRQIRKMGSSCDWSREAYTLDEERTRAVRTMFQKMYEDGLIYRGNRIVNWCPRCASTLSDDEVEHREERAKLFFIRYKIQGGEIVVATARPETKLGDTAVAVHPKDSRYKKFVGKKYDVDLAGHSIHIRVVADAAVDPKFGTGVVGVTPAHSFVDFEIAERHKLPLRQVIGEDGHMTAEAGAYAGLLVADARRKFVDDLRRAGLLEKEEDYVHNVSVCYRCGTTIEPLPKLQWFVDVNKKISGRKKTLKELASAVVRSGEIEIIPKRFTKVYFQWMDNLRDWCISRQIWFG